MHINLVGIIACISMLISTFALSQREESVKIEALTVVNIVYNLMVLGIVIGVKYAG